ncbi:hypothetical protein DPSP01_012138 [Paraphaeosphaeria sporulosa]|uniref:Uncharacterized protein n=1 Tax=Paraphaeosphaeria sporulosa TaxID=1460663 RepID=A0A177BXH7_9PLEO|nr:uncharacterized protein CC84DRAFT_1181289 [Paraphaeosphaeria sporulosa]OAF99835.1 hypothetical protein CC84DRAFT_1181289 [Paraphaeosphaeria sporulosa]
MTPESNGPEVDHYSTWHRPLGRPDRVPQYPKPPHFNLAFYQRVTEALRLEQMRQERRFDLYGAVAAESRTSHTPEEVRVTANAGSRAWLCRTTEVYSPSTESTLDPDEELEVHGAGMKRKRGPQSSSPHTLAAPLVSGAGCEPRQPVQTPNQESEDRNPRGVDNAIHEASTGVAPCQNPQTTDGAGPATPRG